MNTAPRTASTVAPRCVSTALLALGGLLLAADAAHASRPCNNELTRGNWVYTCEGTLPGPPAGAQTDTRILGSCSASGTGFFTCTGTVNLGGLILPQGLQGQASTLPSCRGTISYAQTIGGAPAPNLDIEYVVSEGGDAISGLPTNSGGVLSCSLRRIDK
ncbi:MAG: hypothetical protein MUD07_02515 [Burkholderiaceae bacterium]|jgi:hypothetical protein|nr:hypothetical protein [Burkholderiaceae bacterium]